MKQPSLNTVSYPIILGKVSFCGIGFDKRSFDGVVLYVRDYSIYSGITITQCAKLDNIDDIIAAYVEENLSCFKDLVIKKEKLIIYQEEDWRRLSLYGKSYGYDKLEYGFHIIPDVEGIAAIRASKNREIQSVIVDNLSVYTRALSKEMRETLRACFANLAYRYSTSQGWLTEVSALNQLALTIKNLKEYLPNKNINTMNHYFLMFDVPQQIAGDNEKERVFENSIVTVLDKALQSFAVDVKPFARTLTFSVYGNDADIHTIATILQKEIPTLHFAIFLDEDKDNSVVVSE